MQELRTIDKRIQREVRLKAYQGMDRVIHAEEKKKEIEEQKKFRPPFRATTGITFLDECVDGFRKGQLVVLSGPPKNGKTFLAQTFTRRFVEQGHKCLWFSYELGYEELFEKFPMEKLDFYVPNYMESGNLAWVEDKIIESKQKYGTDIVFIDHLDFLRDPEVLRGISMNLGAYVGSIIQKIKRVAIENDILIFLLSHIRKNQWTTNDLPTSEELADSRQIAQMADIVLMIIRKRAKRGEMEVYEGTEALAGVMENRHNGKTKKFPIRLENNLFVDSNNLPTPKMEDYGY